MCSETPQKNSGQGSNIHAHQSHPLGVGMGMAILCFIFSKYV